MGIRIGIQGIRVANLSFKLSQDQNSAPDYIISSSKFQKIENFTYVGQIPYYISPFQINKNNSQAYITMGISETYSDRYKAFSFFQANNQSCIISNSIPTQYFLNDSFDSNYHNNGFNSNLFNILISTTFNYSLFQNTLTNKSLPPSFTVNKY